LDKINLQIPFFRILLKPVNELDTKYAFHFLKTIELPSAGYSRHFKFLKRTKIAFPKVDEQRRIVAVLDQAEHSVASGERHRTKPSGSVSHC
jgi:type I restriction modification DNA specificity protein